MRKIEITVPQFGTAKCRVMNENELIPEQVNITKREIVIDLDQLIMAVNNSSDAIIQGRKLRKHEVNK